MPEMIAGKKTQRYSAEVKVKEVEWSHPAHRSFQGVAEALNIHPFMLAKGVPGGKIRHEKGQESAWRGQGEDQSVRMGFVGPLTAYGLTQEFTTPYTPEQNVLIERFFRSLKEECIWQHRFESLDYAQTTIGNWFRYYNEQRPHQSLGYVALRAHPALIA